MAVDLVVFDFDGTLAHRPGRWAQCLVDVLDEHRGGHRVSVNAIRSHLRSGFPWHRPEVAHLELSEPEAWWSSINRHLAAAYTAVGVDVDDQLLRAVRDNYCDPRGFRLYGDSIEALRLLASVDIDCVVLSNHVPELESIVAGLGMSGFFERVITSARLGYDKPHPEAYRAALGSVPADCAWMIGDSPTADDRGARAIGMRSILIQRTDNENDAVLLAAARTVLDHHRSGEDRPG